MSAPKPGDRVKVEFEATFVKTYSDGSTCVSDGRGWWHSPPVDATVTVLLPEEPPVKSVAIDREGDAWQRYGAGWFLAGADTYSPRAWGEINSLYGPLTVVYTPDGAA